MHFQAQHQACYDFCKWPIMSYSHCSNSRIDEVEPLHETSPIKFVFCSIFFYCSNTREKLLETSISLGGFSPYWSLVKSGANFSLIIGTATAPLYLVLRKLLTHSTFQCQYENSGTASRIGIAAKEQVCKECAFAPSCPRPCPKWQGTLL